MATHCSILAWRIPWTEDPGGIQSMGSQRARHNCSELALRNMLSQKLQKEKKFKTGLQHLLENKNTSNIFQYLVYLMCIGLVTSVSLTLCNPMDCSPPGSSVHGILQARMLEWVVMPSSRGSSLPRDRTCGSCLASRFFTAEPPGQPQ